MEKTAFLAGGLLTLAVIIVLAVFLVRRFPAGTGQLLTNAWQSILERVNNPQAEPVPGPSVVTLPAGPEKQAARCSRSLENCFVDNAQLDLFFNGQFAASDHSDLIPELDLGQYQAASVDQEWAYIEGQGTRTHVRIYLADMESALYSRPAYVEHFTSQFGVRWKENHTGSLDVIPGGYALPPHTWIFRSPDGVSLMLGTSQNFISVFILSASSGFDQNAVLDGLLRLAGEQVRLLAEGGY